MERLNYPDTILLRPSMGKSLRLTLTAAAFTLGGWWMVSDGDAMGWFVFIFFGLCFMVGVIQNLPGAAGLVVMREGFGVRSLFRARFYPWQDVEGFGVYEIRSHGMRVSKLVGFNTRGTSRPRGAALSVAVSGFTNGLPETYGMAAEELAAALTAFRRAALEDAATIPTSG